jgi:hypothetical protein
MLGNPVVPRSALWIALLALVLAGIAVAVTSGAATTIVAGITYTGGT